MARKESIIHQVLTKIDSLKRFGQSKHQAKADEKLRCEATGETWNPSRVPGIYSHKTCDTYKERALDFARWARETHKDKTLDQARAHVPEYLQSKIDAKQSPWTVQQTASALAKIYDCRVKDFGVAMPKRDRSEITRSRGEKAHDRHFSEHNNRKLVNFCTGTGLRRHELGALKPENIFKSDDRVYVHVEQGKGGRERVVVVNKPYQDHVWKCKEESEGKTRVFDHVPNKADIHGYRREYAQSRYQEVFQERGPSGDTYRTRDGKEYDREALRQVSQDLGHNRENVVVWHYLS